MNHSKRLVHSIVVLLLEEPHTNNRTRYPEVHKDDTDDRLDG